MTETVQPRRTSLLFGLEVDALSMSDVVALAERAVTTRRPLLLGVVNAAKIVKLRNDEVLRDSLLASDLLLADGQAVVWASRLVGQPLPERVAGIDLFEQLLRVADEQHLRVYLLGATPEVLTRLEQVLEDRFPGATLAGSTHGYFRDEESVWVAHHIAATRPDLLFLGMSTPRKETFLARHGEQLGVPVMHGVGGSFDVLAGMTRRAPERWQRLGMEWAFRVLQEPRRLWRRYLVTNTAFLGLVATEVMHPRPAYHRPAGPTTDLPDTPSSSKEQHHE